MENYLLFFEDSMKFHELHVKLCGYEECEPGHSYGPAVREYWLFHIVLSGHGQYTANQHTYQLGAGDGFLIEPGRQTYYEADGEDPWTYCWLGIDGEFCQEILKDLGLGGDMLTFSTERYRELSDIIGRMLLLRKGNTEDVYMAEGLTLQFFSILLSDIGVRITDMGKRNAIVVRAVRYIRDNYADPAVRVAEVARAVNVERGYLYTLFMKYLNLSPQQYLQNFRLTKATELLNHTDLPVKRVSDACGYTDSVTFSKAFKKMFGVSPISYRARSLKNMAKRSEQFAKKSAELTTEEGENPGTSINIRVT